MAYQSEMSFGEPGELARQMPHGKLSGTGGAPSTPAETGRQDATDRDTDSPVLAALGAEVSGAVCEA
ncbi:MAG: hypothetical protein OXI80_21245, partial [Caldilineaceae bacterium]|nr:hypothetical protein [Caldilineaceae bacterium]